MNAGTPSPSFTRLHALRQALDVEAQRRCLREMTGTDLVHLTRSLEFQAILEGAPPELLEMLRPWLRQARPPRVGSVERLCWRPLERFLVDAPEAGSACWLVPRRLLTPLWLALEAAHPEPVEQLKRQHALACFDGDQISLDQVSTGVVDLAAYFFNNTPDLPERLGLNAAETEMLGFIARVMKWHRLVMPNVRYFQQAPLVRRLPGVEALRLCSNWYTLLELLEDQFDLYLLYLFNISADPIHVIDAFPFYFERLEDADCLAMRWLRHRLDQQLQDISAALAIPPRLQAVGALQAMSDKLMNMERFIERLHRLPLLAPDQPEGTRIAALPPQRLSPDYVNRLCLAYLEDLTDLLHGQGPQRDRAREVLPVLSVTLPPLLARLRMNDPSGRIAGLVAEMGGKALYEIDRYLRSHEVSPRSRQGLQASLAPVLTMCEALGMVDTAAVLRGRLGVPAPTQNG
ncbi:hypothetical protein [Niveispirillum sp. BGYR6]|uniref:hypothetical protein n=1 Tax=Niveispirillum sp. BGYR6 TaxID=2971249 RepID=UPI0022B9A334|nr:hypothetical protein [Niveispirillum sp. BGYR6]MDG5494593.1 hypothetical protein [Niveispirillum sp. BGYR6]